MFIGGLVSDKLYSKLDRLLGIWIGGAEVIALVVFKTRLGLKVEGGPFDVGRKVVYGSPIYLCLGFHLKMEEDCSF